MLKQELLLGKDLGMLFGCESCSCCKYSQMLYGLKLKKKHCLVHLVLLSAPTSLEIFLDIKFTNHAWPVWEEESDSWSRSLPI